MARYQKNEKRTLKTVFKKLSKIHFLTSGPEVPVQNFYHFGSDEMAVTSGNNGFWLPFFHNKLGISRLQWKFSKFIFTFQLQKELSNYSETFQLRSIFFQFERKHSNFRLSNWTVSNSMFSPTTRIPSLVKTGFRTSFSPSTKTLICAWNFNKNNYFNSVNFDPR